MRRILPAVATAGVLAAGGAGIALASTGSSKPAAAPAATPVATAAVASPTLHTAKVKVGDKSQTIVVNAKGRPVYLLTGDSVKHGTCTSSACMAEWPAVTGTTATERGVSAKVTIWNHKGIHQVVLNGHPLYLFADDHGSAKANGEGIHSFGGEWDALTPSGKAIDDGGDDNSSASTGSGSSSNSGSGSNSGSSSDSGSSSGSNSGW